LGNGGCVCGSNLIEGEYCEAAVEDEEIGWMNVPSIQFLVAIIGVMLIITNRF